MDRGLKNSEICSKTTEFDPPNMAVTLLEDLDVGRRLSFEFQHDSLGQRCTTELGWSYCLWAADVGCVNIAKSTGAVARHPSTSSTAPTTTTNSISFHMGRVNLKLPGICVRMDGNYLHGTDAYSPTK